MKYSFLLFSLLFSVVLTGCNQAEEQKTPAAKTTNENDAQPVAKEKVSVITSFYALAFFAEQIAGDNAKVMNLAGAQDPHSYKISPQDRVLLSNADLVIYQGVGLESWTEDVIPELEAKNVAVLEASHDLELKPHSEHEDEDHEEGYDDHDDEHEDEHYDEEGHDEHDHGEFDPHTWLDPVLAQTIVEHITEELIAIDEKNAAAYTKNAEELIQKLATLDAEYKNALANCTQEEALVSHNAFGYLEARYGFELHPIAGISPADEPSAKLLAELKNIAETEGVTHILTEENNVKKYAETLAAETGLHMKSINPMGITPSEGNYFDVSRNNLATLSEALSCQ